MSTRSKVQSKIQWLEANLLWIPPGVNKFEGVWANDSDTYDKEVQLEQMTSEFG
jgi:hypothetical protein